MLVQTAAIALLTAAPALVSAVRVDLSAVARHGFSGVNKYPVFKKIVGAKPTKKAKKPPLKINTGARKSTSPIGTGANRFGSSHIGGIVNHLPVFDIKDAEPTKKAKQPPGLKINTGARQSMSPIGTSGNRLGFDSAPYSGRYTPPPFSGGGMASPYGGGYVAPYTPSYASPTSYGGYPYSPQPMVSPYSYQYVRRDTILSPRSELSPRALAVSSYSTPMDRLSTWGRATIGLPGHAGAVLPPKYMRKGTHYRKPKAIHRNYGNDLEMLEGLLEEAERVVNGLEEQLNKPKTLFPEIEAVKRKMAKMHAVKLGVELAGVPMTLATKPTTRAKSG